MKRIVNRADIVFLRGGLGNQFFQWLYALGLQENGRSVVLDVSFLRKKNGNQAIGDLELTKIFNDLQMPIAARFSIIGRAEPLYVRIAHAASFLRIEGKRPILRGEPTQHYGYYQNSNCFTAAVSARIQRAIIPKYRSKSHELFPHKLSDSAYTAIHLRGGDYMQSGYNFVELGVLSKEYYRRALAAVGESTHPIVIVSDDERRARHIINELRMSALDIHYLSDISPDSKNPTLALSVMLSADELVCANSSFSAMCGYLNPRARVFFPSPWFRGKSLAGTSPALSDWHGLPSTFEF